MSQSRQYVSFGKFPAHLNLMSFDEHGGDKTCYKKDGTHYTQNNNDLMMFTYFNLPTT
jgi:hypothetical protein